MQYFYHTAKGKAVLNKGDNSPLKVLGQFKSEAAAKEACDAHFEKARKAAINFGRPIPSKFFL